MCVLLGDVKLALYDTREDSKTHRELMEVFMGETLGRKVVKIPPGVAHGCKTIQGPVNLFYVTSHVYNPDDEVRLPYDDPEIDFDWLKSPTIK